MQRVHKYELPSPSTPLNLPRGAVLLHVAPQRGRLCLWALVTPDAPLEMRHIVVVGTGQDLPDVPLTPIGTIFDGPLVWHAFEAPV